MNDDALQLTPMQWTRDDRMHYDMAIHQCACADAVATSGLRLVFCECECIMEDKMPQLTTAEAENTGNPNSIDIISSIYSMHSLRRELDNICEMDAQPFHRSTIPTF